MERLLATAVDGFHLKGRVIDLEPGLKCARHRRADRFQLLPFFHQNMRGEADVVACYRPEVQVMDAFDAGSG